LSGTVVTIDAMAASGDCRQIIASKPTCTGGQAEQGLLAEQVRDSFSCSFRCGGGRNRLRPRTSERRTCAVIAD